MKRQLIRLYTTLVVKCVFHHRFSARLVMKIVPGHTLFDHQLDSWSPFVISWWTAQPCIPYQLPDSRE